ncbi:MAG TPA: PilC/PilY family type IV pilus protein [Noviherbaspirillum sp.]|uniref:pilus assembly protein n=1 Tax=Noviherbaspirillum sp. TaxID=1926288 RepID=UPI002B48EAC6|nr:PilC/PilY family type IV pilus protein [Noviherbaspirillum sp.]HJV85917.1 PilC/PilY family type IV pilus protein [Noviherbaspirillum sp.]
MKKTMSLFRAGLLAALLLAPLAGRADDIDIYDGNNTGTTPNLLIVIDNAASFSASGESCKYVDGTSPTLNNTGAGLEQCALYNVLASLKTKDDGSAKVNIGFMMYSGNYNATYGCPSSNTGGCLVKPLTPMTDANKAAFQAWVKGWDTSGQASMKANGATTAAIMQEAWAYFAGKTGLSGAAYSGVTGESCQKNYVVFIGNADKTPNDGNNVSAPLTTAPGISDALKSVITIPSGCYGTYGYNATCPAVVSPALSCGTYAFKSQNHTDTSGLYADEWARYMYQVDLGGTLGGQRNITTYTVSMLTNKCVPDLPALMTSMANVGGGKYFPTYDYNGLSDALAKILNEVQAVNSVFASSSLPVSVNTQGTYLNQIYMGMFRPDKDGNPRWVGNLKQYQFNLDTSTNTLRLADSTGASAISSAGTGFISPNAVSFWTVKNTAISPDSTGGFWKNNPQGAGLAYDSPDGEVVEKGGAAQRLRIDNLIDNYASAAGSSTNPRRLYTYCPGGSSCIANLTDSSNTFATGNTAITQAMLGVSSDTDRTNLINWVRGQDNKGDEKGPGGSINVRPSIHGDVLHSRPVVISYGGVSESVVVYYGSNDGVFHAINGNQTTAIGGVPAGSELWGLVLPEFYGKLKRQRDNSPVLKLATTDPDLHPQPKDYFVDGPAGMYQKLNADGSIARAYIYLTMRRGGRFLYAIDVTTPASPRVLWRKSYSDAGMGELGQTWSRPRLAVVKGNANPVLIFGAGYSTSQDSEPPTDDTMGRGIFVLDAVTGNIVWSAGPAASATLQVTGMDYSIAADIALLDRDADGYVERLYAADVGGNVWRVDLEPTGGSSPAQWQVTKLAALGCDGGVCGSGTTPRKFLFQPSIVPVGAPAQPNSYDAVLVGSGDREHPLYSNGSYSVTNRLYMLKDTKPGKDGAGQTTITEGSLFNATNAAYDGSVRGYYVTLGSGEKSVNAPLTVGGVTNFGTNQALAPDPNSCSTSLGVARIYSLGLFDASKTSTTLDGGGLPPSPVSGVVSIDGKKVGFCIGCVSAIGQPPQVSTVPCKSALENCYKDADVQKKTKRTYWYKK